MDRARSGLCDWFMPKHGGSRHVAQPHAAREPGQDVCQVLHTRVHADEPAAVEDRVRDRGTLAARD